MRLGFDLTLEQAQKLIMTPELRQAIQILQFTSQELWQYVEKQMESNPLLDIDPKSKSEENFEDFKNRADDIDWNEYFEKYDDISYKTYRRTEENVVFDNYINTGRSLKEHLLFQLNFAVFDKKSKAIGEMLIDI